jgi:hypothetical protein
MAARRVSQETPSIARSDGTVLADATTVLANASGFHCRSLTSQASMLLVGRLSAKQQSTTRVVLCKR